MDGIWGAPAGAGAILAGACIAGITLAGAGAIGAGAILVGATGAGITLAGDWAVGRDFCGAWALAAKLMLKRAAEAKPNIVRSITVAFSMIHFAQIGSNDRDRVHDHRDWVDPLYGIIDCALWEFCEFSNEYDDFFGQAWISPEISWFQVARTEENREVFA